VFLLTMFSKRLRRLIMLDIQLGWIADRMRDDLGRWFSRREKLILRRRDAAREDLVECGWSFVELEGFWEEQRSEQTKITKCMHASIRRLPCTNHFHTVTKLQIKQQVQAVMRLQDAIAKIETDIETAEAPLTTSVSTSKARETRKQLRHLRDIHKRLCAEADELYVSLNIDDDFPTYKQYGRAFVQTLIMAFDAKAILRHKLTGRFFEWDRIGRAVGGVHTPVGGSRLR
jgi:hypothetical protein